MQGGFTRLFRDGETIDLQKPEDYKFEDFEETFVLIDRLKADKSIRQRLVDSLEICFRESHSAMIQTAENKAQTLNFSETFVCKNDGTIYEEPEPRLFSFNSPFGACPTCQGFGNSIGIDFDLVVPNENLSIENGAVEPFTRPQYDWALKALKGFCLQRRNSDEDIPFADLTDAEKTAIFEGKGKWKGVRRIFQLARNEKI